MGKPKIKLKLERIHWVLEMICVLALVLMVVLIVISYADLPEQVVKHFSFSGHPNGFWEKSNLWFLPMMASILYGALTILTRFPHVFNYPYPITKINAQTQYKNSVLLVGIVKTVVVIMFLCACYLTIQIGLGNRSGLGVWFAPLTIASILTTIIVFAVRGYKLRALS